MIENNDNTQEEQKPTTSFADLGLPKNILSALTTIGYKEPSDIQASTIPLLLQGEDLLGQAQTGTGKTAAFALPLISRANPDDKFPQVLVLAPTRELAVQVAKAFEDFSKDVSGLNVISIYGGQSYDTQIRALKRGTQIIVGTPGRVMDHMKRKTLKLDRLQSLVLDEADEMLRMGFIDDVEWVLSHTPDTCQIALFSATMPSMIQRIAENYLKSPKIVKIKTKTMTAENVKQTAWIGQGRQKIVALTRILEMNDYDGVIIFVRTKQSTTDLANDLMHSGIKAAALNGDMQQKMREQVIEQLKKGRINIVIATDVAARGIDVPRITHVINYDAPHDIESYVHRIGRTGRAGREGNAILFLNPRERGMLRSIERVTKQKVEVKELPTVKEINEKRKAKFQEKLIARIEKTHPEQDFFNEMLNEIVTSHGVDPMALATALAQLTQEKNKRFLLDPKHDEIKVPTHTNRESNNRGRERNSRFDRDDRSSRNDRSERRDRRPSRDMTDFDCYELAAGKMDDVQPRHIVGAIANELGIHSRDIHKIQIMDDKSYVSLSKGMSKDVLHKFTQLRINNCKSNAKIANNKPSSSYDDNSSSNRRPSRDRNERGSRGRFNR